MRETLTGLIASYGYGFLFVLVAIESLGIPLPGETGLVTAAAFAASGRLNIVLVIVVAAAAAISGDNTAYWAGRRGGLALVRRYGSHVGLNDERLAKTHAFFKRHGAKTVFFARFIAVLRSWAAALAGVGGMPYHTFLPFNALGGATWATVFGVLGYVFGRNLPTLERYVRRFGIVVAVLAGVGVVVIVVWRIVKRRGKGRKA